MIKTERITFKRGQRKILKNVSMAVEKGKITVLAGPNAAGKSTLLKILSGELKSDSGEVFFDGLPLPNWSPEDLARRRGVLPQMSKLNFPFRVIDVVLLGRIPHLSGPEKKGDYDIARATLREMDLAEFENRSYNLLSEGEKQRVQTARVLAQIWDPPKGENIALLLDEPTSSLDINHQFTTLRLAKTLADGGGAVFAILHDLNHAAGMADTLYVMDHGEIVARGAPSEVLKPSLIAKVFKVEAKIIRNPLDDSPLILMRPME